MANGVVHAIVGGIALAIAITGKGDSDQNSALANMASVPAGLVALWILAVLLWMLALFFIVDGITQAESSATKKWGRRFPKWGQAVVFAVTGGIASSVAMGSRSDSDSSAEKASRGLLDIPGGPVLLGLIGAALAVGGLVFVGMGLLRRFEKQMRLPDDARGTAVRTFGIIGFVAKGSAVAVIGVLITSAAIKNDPDSAGALDTAVQTLRDLPGGSFIVGTLGIGLIAYGVFCALRARYTEL